MQNGTTNGSPGGLGLPSFQVQVNGSDEQSGNGTTNGELPRTPAPPSFAPPRVPTPCPPQPQPEALQSTSQLSADARIPTPRPPSPTSTSANTLPTRPSHSRSSSLDRTNAPTSITLPDPPVPPLDPTDTPWDTNTLALLLPHASLFAPEALQLLRDAFAAYGTLAHWAPVRAMGRVIIVYTDDHAAEMAKREGDGIKLQVDLDEEQEEQPQEERGERNYFSRHRRKNSRHGIILRVYALPRTSLSAEKDHLRPPELERNFLISPPGSPPEGWEPIAEDGPNMAPLADDLRRALEALQLTGLGRRAGPEVILVEGGVRVEVEDTDRPDAEEGGWYERDDREWGTEEVQSGGSGIWSMNTQSQPTLAFDDLGGGGGGGVRGPLTPSGRIMPTARPPMPSD